MCVSAAASVTVGAVLIPVGVYCAKQAWVKDHLYLPFAVFPIAFGIQQIIEGMVWLTAVDQVFANWRPAAYGFMFFSHFFWLFWVPFSVWMIEPDRYRKKLALVFTLAGGLFGASLYFPLLINEGWLTVEVIQGSLDYKATTIYDDYVPRILLRVTYALIVLIPLLSQSHRLIRYFGILILLSVIVSAISFGYAFISIWCFMAAILSTYTLYMADKIRKQEFHSRPMENLHNSVTS